MSKPVKPAPPGWKWIFCDRFWHARAKKYLVAADYGHELLAIV